MDGWMDGWMDGGVMSDYEVEVAYMMDGWMGQEEIVQMLLKHGAPAKENKFGLTLRMVATQKGNFKVAALLLKPAHGELGVKASVGGVVDYSY